MISTVTLNPALDKSVYIDRLRPNDANRIIKIEIDAGGKGVNASRMLKELGSQTVALGFLGGQTGRFIEQV
ncbi:MAG: 1-phosphofructokinase, partial [Armatimonadetes bacterium]|nr:1-phosphofructokinase [Armatimonadota bacterium]